MKTIVAPSLLAADKTKLVEEILDIENKGAEWLHFDVMDGVFVPNTSFSLETLNNIHDKHHLLNDVHVMIENPMNLARLYVKNGADLVTFHIEACPTHEDVIKTINSIKELGCKVGISIKPKTSPVELVPYLDLIDLVLVMSVEPGFGGQKFMPIALDKIAYLRKYIDDCKLNVLIEVDGGINGETGQQCLEKGADVLVAGTYVFRSPDRKASIDSLR